MEVLHNSCNMCTCVLPDMYSLIPWICGSREFGCTYQAEHLCSYMLQLLNVHNLVQHHIETADVKPMLEEFLCST